MQRAIISFQGYNLCIPVMLQYFVHLIDKVTHKDFKGAKENTRVVN